MFILDSEYETFMKSELADSDELIVYISNTLDTDFLLLSMETITPNTNECEVISVGRIYIHLLSAINKSKYQL